MSRERRRVPWVRPDGREVTRTEIQCSCGEWVLCAYFTNTCSCGADYNMSGQRLAPRSQWGEETGEHPADVARITGYETGVDWSY